MHILDWWAFIVENIIAISSKPAPVLYAPWSLVYTPLSK